MDNNIFANLNNLPDEAKQRMSTMIDKLQTRDSLRLYNSIVERCFKDCVNTFYRKSLNKQEETCVLRCAEKFMRLSTQTSMRFSDLNQEASTNNR